MTVQTERLVSVIIPVFNCEAYLAEAIESVLAQTYSAIEIIVVDDGSTDGSADIAKSFGNSGVRFCYQPNSGPGSARNRGVAMARGGLLAFLDADDMWLPNKLSLQTAALESNPKLDMILGHVAEFLSPELGSGPQARVGERQRILPGYGPDTLLIRRHSFLYVGHFATDWRVGEFLDWYAKAMDAGLQGLMLPDVVTQRRIHASNLGIRERQSQRDYVRILKIALDRRRKDRPPVDG